MKKFLLTLFLLSIQICTNADPEAAATVAISQITMRSEAELQADLEEAGFAVFAQRTASLLASVAGQTVRPHDIFWALKRAKSYYSHLGLLLSIEEEARICSILVNNNQEDLAAVRAAERHWNSLQLRVAFDWEHGEAIVLLE